MLSIAWRVAGLSVAPRFARDARWSETGDRYVLKLFRDYVFHQTDESGNPLTSLAHVLGCLSKVGVGSAGTVPRLTSRQLDAGSEERILLIARDEQSCVVATYREIKAIADSAFRYRPPFLFS
jgi:PAB-dependent poly(A)-specific ribonuclease subunit 3